MRYLRYGISGASCSNPMSQHLGADRTTAGGHAKFAPGPAVPAPSCPSNEALYLDSSIPSSILIWTFKAAAVPKHFLQHHIEWRERILNTFSRAALPTCETHTVHWLSSSIFTFIFFRGEYFQGEHFQGVNISRGEYFSGVNIFQRWTSFRSEYLFRLSFAQWNIGYSHAMLLEGKGSKKICEKAVMCLEVVTNPGFF